MTQFVLILMVVSIAVLPYKRINLHDKVVATCLGAIALCYIGLISLTINASDTVVYNDGHPGHPMSGWFGSDWLYVLCAAVIALIVLHVVVAVYGRRKGTKQQVSTSLNVAPFR